MLKGFREFIMRGNVVDLAVAIVIGTAFGAVVNALVRDILTPLIAAIFGKPDFSSLTFTIHKSTFRYGDLINSVISFVLIAAAVYFFVVAPLNRLAERRARRRAAGLDSDETLAEKPEEIVVLEQIRDLLSAQRTL
jgi:large conductance mechanosensitive channel